MKKSALAIAMASAMLWPAIAAAQTKVKVGVTRAVVTGGALTALDKGYFKEAGLDVEIDFLDASSSAIALLARSQYQVIEGGISASFFNGLQQGLPVKIALDTVSTPIGHNLMVRTGLKDQVKSLKDLKGKIIGVNAPNSIVLYELTRVLESEGMSLDDIQTKVVAFPQIGVAFSTGAIDAAIVIPPWTAQIPEQGLGVPLVDVDKVAKPAPMTISVTMYNTDWEAANKDAAQKYFTALLRGVRDYCSAYHGGPTRAAVAGVLVKNGVVPSPEFLDRLPWNSRNPNGEVQGASVLDIQKWYVKQGLVKTEVPLDRIVESRFAKTAVQALGPFNAGVSGELKPGCQPI
jgi:NitT/TauT family transport system substrate-binding protein